MFWLLLALLLLLCLVALAFTLLTLWRRLKALGRQMAEVSTTMADAQQAIDAARADGPMDTRPCPTCGATTRTATLRAAGVLQ